MQDAPPQDEAPHMDQRISWLCSHVVGQETSEPQGHAGPDGVPATYSHTAKAKDPALDAAAPGGVDEPPGNKLDLFRCTEKRKRARPRRSSQLSQ